MKPLHLSRVDLGLQRISNLGLVLDSQGKYEQAEVIHRRDLEGYLEAFGPRNSD